MDQPSNQAAPSQTQQRPAHRDMMFCHECADEWYRDEHGLTCPECGSDFTEIIEENNDPRDSVMFGHDGDDSDSMPDLADVPHHQHPHHNPWQSDDPEEADISNYNIIQTAPGRFNVQATITRSVSPQGLGASMAPASIGGFMSMLNGLAGVAGRQPPQPQGQTRGQGAGLFSAPNQPGNQSAFQEASSQGGAGQPQIRTGRFTYHGGARLFPRDANNPEPRIEPVDDITNVMAGLIAALGAPPGTLHAQQHQSGAEAPSRGGQNPDEAQRAAHPFFQLFTSMGLLGGAGGQMGDFVYSQEGLDRIVSQLMEQTATSNAPGPASQADIDALPRKNVTEDMLGPEGTAECSICMDEVVIGEQVTVLPCKHWFHHQCVSAWLLEHDTCPHCRKGITKQQQGESNQASSGAQASSPGAADRTSQMPGAFNVSGTGTSNDPFHIPGDSASSSPPNNNPAGSTGDGNANSGNGGISDRIRRGLFGPQS
ncbi:Nn.00g031660.m01.CDS01 [Neocucurbitaria sp. VM-36]